MARRPSPPGAWIGDSYAALQDPVIRGLLPKFVSAPDPEIEAEFPTNMSGKVTILAKRPELHPHRDRAEGRAVELPHRG